MNIPFYTKERKTGFCSMYKGRDFCFAIFFEPEEFDKSFRVLKRTQKFVLFLSQRNKEKTIGEP